MRGLRRTLGVVVAAASALAVLSVGGGAPAQAAPARDPVIVVNGLFGVRFAYEPLVARLRADGYRVWDFELPTLGTQDIRLSAQALNAFADAVRTQTGAAKVDLVGHSEGGLVSRAYVKYYGGAAEVTAWSHWAPRTTARWRPTSSACSRSAPASVSRRASR
jgi:triacylglycerol esterase/lipase EstA (alpha/beta hydrolase family)